MKTLIAATAVALTLTAGAVTAQAREFYLPRHGFIPLPIPRLVVDVPVVVPVYHRHHGPVVVVPEPYCTPTVGYYGRPYYGHSWHYHER